MNKNKYFFFNQGTKNYIKINKCKNKKSKSIIIITKDKRDGENIVYSDPLALYNVLFFAFRPFLLLLNYFLI
jgi:hypothetical protein